MVSATDKAYIAGFVDGEGSLYITTARYGAMVDVTQKNPRVLEFIQRRYNGNIYRSKYSGGYHLKIGRVDQIRRFLLDIVLYMQEKQLQAIYMLAYCETVRDVRSSRSGVPLTQEEKEIRSFIANKLVQLKGRGK